MACKVTEVEEGGYDVLYVEEPHKSLLCTVCHLALKKAIQISDCGHRFCQVCFYKLKRNTNESGIPFLCPLDRQIIDTSKVFSDKGIDREVLELKVYCNNKGKNCEWKGDLNSMMPHLNLDCDYELVSCAHDGCNINVERKELEEHMSDCSKRIVIAADNLKLIKILSQRLDACEEDVSKKYEERFKRIHETQEELRDQLEESNEKLKETSAKLNEKNEQLYELKEQLNGTNYDLNETKVQLNETKDEWNETKEKLNETRDELNETKERLNETKEQVNETKEHLNETKEKLNETRDELNETKERLNETKEQVNETKEQWNETKVQLNETKDEMDVTKGKIEELNQQLNGTKDELNETKEQLNKTKAALKQTNAKLNETKQQLEETKASFKETKGHLITTKDQLNETKDGLKETREQLNGTNEKLKGTNNQLVETKEQLNEAKEHLNNQLKETRGQLKTKEDEIKQYQEEMKHYQNVVSQQFDTLGNQLNKKDEDFKKFQNDVSFRFEKLKSNNADLKEELSEKLNEKVDLIVKKSDVENLSKMVGKSVIQVKLGEWFTRKTNVSTFMNPLYSPSCLTDDGYHFKIEFRNDDNYYNLYLYVFKDELNLKRGSSKKIISSQIADYKDSKEIDMLDKQNDYFNNTYSWSGYILYSIHKNDIKPYIKNNCISFRLMIE